MHDQAESASLDILHAPKVSANTSGEMARLIAEKNWSETPLGSIETWSASLNLCVKLILASGFPMAVRWGPRLIMLYNDAYVPILGDKHPQVLGRPLSEVWPEIYQDLGPLSQSILQGERNGFFAKHRLWKIRRHGSIWEDARFTISYSAIPDPTAANGIGGILVTAVETTADAHTAQRFRRLTEKLEYEVTQRTRERDRIWEVSEDLLGVSNFEGYFVRVNPAWTRLLGWSEEEIKRMHVGELRHPDDAAAAMAELARLANGVPTVRMENRFRHKDGSWRWLSWILTAEAGVIYVIGRHITEEKEAAERLRESERQFRLLVGGVIDYALFKLTTDGIVSSWNTGAERIKGYSAHDIIGQHYSRFYTEEDKRAGLPARALHEAALEGRYEMEGWRIRKDGTRFFASVVIDAIHDETGGLIGFAKITRDITERREAQLTLQRTQEQLAQSQKMDALGQLTGGIAHDFNNMLMVVCGYTQFLKQRLNDARDVRAIDAIELAANRAENLTRQLLTFSRRQSLNPVTANLAQCLQSVRDILTTSAKGNISLTINVPDELWPVTVDINEFEVAIVNLLLNARDAMPNGGTIKITARNAVFGADDEIAGLRGDFVVVDVQDCGMGIPSEILPKVFDPFFTTKETDRGTGLGLSQVFGFAHQAGGSVKIASEVEVGTTVTLYLPRSEHRLGAVLSRDGSGKLPVGKEVVLLVEDNSDVMSVAATMLRQLGYQVVEANSAERALTTLRAGTHIDLVLTDIIMPGLLDGFALARRISEGDRRLPVLLSTGYSKAVSDVETGFPVLRKPYQLAALAQAVRAAIDHRKTPTRTSKRGSKRGKRAAPRGGAANT